MKTAKIAQFKANLSKYLRYVSKGEEIVIFDRDTPIARVIPFKQEDGFILEEAVDSPEKLFSTRVGPVPGLESNRRFLLPETSSKS